MVSKEPNNSKVEEGGEVELECEVRGTPTPKVMWLLNGEPLDNDTHALIRGLSSLPDLLFISTTELQTLPKDSNFVVLINIFI